MGPPTGAGGSGHAPGMGDAAGLGPVAQLRVVPLPDAPPLRLNLGARLQLRVKEGGEQVRGEIARAQVDPGVLVHLAAKEAAAVGAFLPDDLGALDVLPVA